MNRSSGLALATCIALLAGQAAVAGSDVGSNYVAPQIQGVWLDDGREADDGVGFSMAFGAPRCREDWNFEIGLAAATTRRPRPATS